MKMKNISKKMGLFLQVILCFNMIVTPASASDGYMNVEVKPYEYTAANDTCSITIGQDDDFIDNVKSIREKVTTTSNITNVTRIYSLKDGSSVTDYYTITENNKDIINSGNSITALSGGTVLGSISASARRVESMGTAFLNADFEWDSYLSFDNKVRCKSVTSYGIQANSGWMPGDTSVEYSSDWVYIGSAHATHTYTFNKNNSIIFYQGILSISCSDNGSIS